MCDILVHTPPVRLRPQTQTGALPARSQRAAQIVMRPLLLHASSSSPKPEPRRVIHLEFAVDDLPVGWSGTKRFDGNAGLCRPLIHVQITGGDLVDGQSLRFRTT